MKSDVQKWAKISLLLFTGLMITGLCRAQNGDPWQIGDVVVCYGSGHCNVIRIFGGTPTLLDSVSDGLLGTTSGSAMNNTLHLLTTDNGVGTGSTVVQYSIASVNPLTGTPLTHTVLNRFNSRGSNSSGNIQSLVVNSAGHMFAANANPATIVELSPTGTLLNTYLLPPSCIDSQLGSIDLSADGSSIYLTSRGGTIQKFTFSNPSSCTPFANFGNKVTLYTIKDIPAGALTGQTCGLVACPSDETLLVSAIGVTDPDGAESGETLPDPDAVNICTNVADQIPVSCALLLDTNPNPGLTAPLWQGGTHYFSLGSQILDPSLKIQSVLTAGTSGGEEPSFNEAGGTVIDNAVIWTDKGQPAWTANTNFSMTGFPGTYVVDSNLNLQTVTTSGISGPSVPNWSASSTTVDGLVWRDQGAWQANHTFAIGAPVGDAAGHVHTVLTSGTSGSSLPSWNDGGGTTIDNAVTWTNQGPVVSYSANHSYGFGTYIAPNGHIQQAVEPGTSGSTTPPFSTLGARTIDGAVTWTDQGQQFWHPGYAFPLGAVVVDPAGHIQQVTTAGTSGATQPLFNDAGSTTADNTMTWTDQGVLSWAANTNYDASTAAKTFVVDGAQHVQRATTAGISGPAAPAFVDGGTTNDNGVVWTDQGLKFWYPNFNFSGNAIIVDAGGHVQQVTIAGTSAPTQPTFNHSNGSVVDGLQWTDQNIPGTWQATTSYATNTVILDGAGHVQQVITAGTSGVNTPGFDDGGGTTSDGSVVWQDRGIPGTWTASTAYAINAVISDGSGHIQQATSVGTSASGSAPTFSSSGGTIADNAVVWSDQGLLVGNSVFNWQPNQSYSANARIVDAANHVQAVSTSGTSGAPQPNFNDGGQVIDGLVWADLGALTSWSASASFPIGTLSLDSGSFLQKVTTTGITGVPGQPVWNETPGHTTVDGLQWTDQGQSQWTAGHLYSTLGAMISDPATHAQRVDEAGTSGGSQPSFNDFGGTTRDNAVVWTESHPTWTPTYNYVTGNSDTLVLDSHSHVQLVSTTGISGPTVPPFTSNQPVLGQTIDGLQWQNSPATSSVIARYPVSGFSDVRSLALDPLIADCTGSNCASTLRQRSISQFWMGDNTSGKFFSIRFNSTGAFTTYDANPGCTVSCPITSVQSIAIYGGEGSNQPGFTKLFSGSVSGSGAPGNTGAVQFPLPFSAADTNSFTVSAYNLPGQYGMNLYGSLVNAASCFSDGSPSLPCEPTTSDPTKAIVWKTDIPTTVALALSSPAYVSEKVKGPAGVDLNTDIFTDAFYDTTVSSGNIDPIAGNKASVETLNERTPQFTQAQSGCFYVSPAANACYKTNRGTLNFTFQCPNLLPSQFISLQNPPGPPLASLVRSFPPVQGVTPSPQIIYLINSSGTNGKGPYRYSSSSNAYVFQWSLSKAVSSGQISGTGTSKVTLCSYDSNVLQPFCVNFKTDPNCK